MKDCPRGVIGSPPSWGHVLALDQASLLKLLFEKRPRLSHRRREARARQSHEPQRLADNIYDPNDSALVQGGPESHSCLSYDVRIHDLEAPH